ncbi:MAG: hypothetical protein ABSF38_20820 [Verrucomicrobiota bacterium]|jgi:hypothetical protein
MSEKYVLRVKYPWGYQYFDPQVSKFVSHPNQVQAYIAVAELARQIATKINQSGVGGTAEAILLEQAVREHK